MKYKVRILSLIHIWYSVIGDVIFCHPLAYSSGMMATSEKARRFFKDEGYEFGCLVMAHTHLSLIHI